MTRDELVERVARAIDSACVDWQKANASSGVRRWDVPGDVMARAAIRVVVEECARVADDFAQTVLIQSVSEKSLEERKAYSDGYWEAAEEVAAAIRALAGKEDGNE